MKRYSRIVATAITLSCALHAPAQAGSANGVSTTTAPDLEASSATLPQWDVISIHPVEGQDCRGNAGMRTTTDGMNIVCVPLLFVIEQAYAMRDSTRIIGAPDWVRAYARFDIDAKVAAEDIPTFNKLSRDDQYRMLRALLADRFRFKGHTEQREMAVYDIVVAKAGPKLKQPSAEEADQSRTWSRERGKIETVNRTLESLTWVLTGELGRPVLDKTGLTAKYDWTLNYTPDSATAVDQTSGPSVFAALEEQLGLKLQPAKEPMDVLVIDSIDHPAAN